MQTNILVSSHERSFHLLKLVVSTQSSPSSPALFGSSSYQLVNVAWNEFLESEQIERKAHIGCFLRVFPGEGVLRVNIPQADPISRVLSVDGPQIVLEELLLLPVLVLNHVSQLLAAIIVGSTDK